MHPLFAPAEAVLEALAPHPVYAVGGAVRCVVLGQPTQGIELDLCTPLLPEQTLTMAKAAGLAMQTQGIKWGCVNVAGFEVTSFRTEHYTRGSRHPAVQFGVTLNADAKRRDFTCNAIYMETAGNITDPYHGAAHLKAGRVVWVENPMQKLAEDPIRWWRWLRFCGAYGVASLEAPTWAEQGGTEHDASLLELAEALLPHTQSVSSTRWEAEKHKASHTKHAARVRKTLQDTLAIIGKKAEILMP